MVNNKKSTIWVISLTVVALLIVAASFWLFNENRTLNQKISSLEQSTNELGDKLDESVRIIEGEIYNSVADSRVLRTPEADFVYFPELKIRLPFNELSKSLIYSIGGELDVDSDEELEADVTSSVYVKPDTDTTYACHILARIKIEPDPKPYNENEKPTSVNLKDGRKLQVYQPVNQAECDESWEMSVSPEMVVAEFEQADSY